jgi:dihydrofolate reductase
VAKFVFGMNQSVDGRIDHTAFAPGPRLFRYFIDQTGGRAGAVYGREMYQVMRYWDEHQANWTDEEHAFASAWCKMPKWVVSRSLERVGPNATLVAGDLERAMREIKAAHDGVIEVGGPELAHSLGELGLVDEYQIYLHPVVVGEGKRFFAGARPRLRLTGTEMVDEDVIRLTYVPA